MNTKQLHQDLTHTEKSLEAMLVYTRTVKRVADDLSTLTRYFDASTPIGRRMRDLLQELSDDADSISDTANKAAANLS